MNDDRRHHGTLWPSPDQERLLKAALLDGEAAIPAFRAWRQGFDPEAELGYPLLRLLPLVWQNLQRLGVDDPIMGRLKGVYRRFWCENQALFFAMRPVLRQLRADGVELLMLKGVPLVASYYRNSAVRPMADFDIAIRPQQLGTAADSLRKLGWWVKDGPSADDLRFFHALPCAREPYVLDLHYHFLRECVNAQADAWFWADIEPMSFEGIDAWQPGPTALLLHTVLHGMRWNPETPVRWIADAVTLLRQRGDAIDWPRLLRFADEQRVGSRLALGLLYLDAQFAIALPDAVRQRLQAYRPGLRERIANRALLGEFEPLNAHALGTQVVLFAEYCSLVPQAGTLQLLDGFGHFLRYRWRVRGRRELLSVAGRGLLRRLGRR